MMNNKTESKLSFSKYLSEHSHAFRPSMLTEGIEDLKPQLFPHVNVLDAVRFLLFMPDWNDNIVAAETKLTFESDEQLELFKEHFQLYVASSKNPKRILSGLSSNIKRTGGSFVKYVIKNPGELSDKDFEKYCQDLFGAIARVVKQKNLTELMRVIQRSGSEIAIKGEGTQLAQAWSIITAICENDDIAGTIAYVSAKMRALKQTTDNDQRATIQREMQDAKTRMQTAMSNINVSGKLSDDDLAKTKALTIQEAQTISCSFKGNYETCFLAYINMLTYRGDKSVLNTVTNSIIPESSVQSIASLQTFKRTKNFICEDDKIADTPVVREFQRNTKFLGELSQQQRKLLRMLNDEIAPRPADWTERINRQIDALTQKLKQVDDDDVKAQMNAELKSLEAKKDTKQLTFNSVLGYLQQNAFGVRIYNYLKDRAEFAHSIEQSNLSKEDKESQLNALPADVINYKSLSDMLTAVTKHTDKIFNDNELSQTELDKQTRLQNVKTYQPQLSNATAQRRLKLFKAVKNKGAEVFSNQNWTAAIISTNPQISVFGRNKPKVDSRNQIIVDANLEDSEGITPQNKKIRDGNGLYIKDGISTVFDKIMTETCWCVAGAYSNHHGGQHANPWEAVHGSMGYTVKDIQLNRGVLIAILDHSDGRLYLTGGSYILGENDDYDGRLAGNDGIKTLIRNCKQISSFNNIIRDSGIWDRIVEPKAGNVKIKTPGELLVEALDNGRLTGDGVFHAKGADDLKNYKKILKNITKIRIESSDASEFFKDYSDTAIDLPVIDCENVTCASEMFKNTNIPEIRLENTDNITDMESMFENVKTTSIIGLNTVSAETLRRTFYNCRPKVFTRVNIPSLDLTNCRDLSQAFAHSYISTVNIRNTAKVRDALDAFINMPFLNEMPNIKFTGIFQPFKLRSGFNGEYVNIFDGCDTLLGGKKFDKDLVEIEQFYMHHPTEGLDITDERGFFVVTSAETLRQYAHKLYEFPGIVIAENLGSYKLFNGYSNLKIRVLDLNGRSDVSNMFSDCTNLSIGRIIGTENVKTASSMFSGCRCNICPKLDFPALTGEIRVFTGMHPFGNIMADGLFKAGRNITDFKISETDQNQVITIMNQLFGSTAAEWISATTPPNVVQNIYYSVCHNRDSLIAEMYKLDNDGVVEISQLTDIQNNISMILQLKPRVIRFSNDLVKELDAHPIQIEAYSRSIWDKASNKYMPVIDLNGLKNGQCLFMNANFDDLAGIIGTENIETAHNMFRGAHVKLAHAQQAFPTSKTSFPKLKDATTMFYMYNGKIACDMLEFPMLETAEFMFKQTRVSNCGLKAFKSVVNANGMFMASQFVDSPVNATVNVEFPNLTSAHEMFQQTVNFPATASIFMPKVTDAKNMFRNNQNIRRIARIEMPSVTDISWIFASCSNLKSINTAKFNRTKPRSDSMFSCCPLESVYGINGESFLTRMAFLASA